MGLTLKRFLFEDALPSLETVYARVCERSDEPVRFVNRRHKGASLLAKRKFDSVGLVWNAPVIEVHGMLGAGLVPIVTEVLRAAGGRHPLPQRDPENPEYGEAWMGILATGTDLSIRAGERSFTIWDLYLTMDLLPDGELVDALAELPHGESITLRREELEGLLAAMESDEPPTFQESPEVRDALLRFLSEAAARGVVELEIDDAE